MKSNRIHTHLSELDEVITLKEYAERVENCYKTLMDQIEV